MALEVSVERPQAASRRCLDAVCPARLSECFSSVHADRGERRAPSSRRPTLVPGDDGVARGAQRQGVGGRLLEPVLEIADRDQVDCYLETVEPRNAEYYARHGFVVENPALQLVSDGPAHITMRRRPTAAPGCETNRALDERKTTNGNGGTNPMNAPPTLYEWAGGVVSAADGLLLRPRRA